MTTMKQRNRAHIVWNIIWLLKAKYRRFKEIFITGCTGTSCGATNKEKVTKWRPLCFNVEYQRNSNIVISKKFSTLVALKAVNSTTTVADSDKIFVRMTTFLFQWWTTHPFCKIRGRHFVSIHSNNWSPVRRWVPQIYRKPHIVTVFTVKLQTGSWIIQAVSLHFLF